MADYPASDSRLGGSFGGNPFGQPLVDLSRLIDNSARLVIAISNLNQTIASVFPQGTAVTAATGAASGNYLTIIAPDGVTYKIALNNVA